MCHGSLYISVQGIFKRGELTDSCVSSVTGRTFRRGVSNVRLYKVSKSLLEARL